MVIEWPGSYCDSDSTQAHYMTVLKYEYKLTLFKCKYCDKFKILPNVFDESVKLGNLMKQYGAAKGYQEYINLICESKRMIATVLNLQELQRRKETNNAEAV